MTDLDLTRAIEERMLNAWPAVETMIAGDWLLRFANGYSKRANSATSLTRNAHMDDAAIAHLIERARLWNIPATVRITPNCAATLDARLAAHGFAEIDATFGMISAFDGPAAIDPRVIISPTPTREWIAANASSYGGVKANATKLAAILDRIRPDAAFATLVEGGRPCAWGIGVIERGFVGLQDITVAPDLRGRGVGRALIASLMAWGRARRADRAYLHVLGTNEPARALYRRLGFSDAFRMTHRILPAS